MPELTRRYIVMAMANEAPFDANEPEAPFVLKPWKDPAALRALETYRDHCYPELAADLTAWIQTIAAGPRLRGGVGARNEAHLASTNTLATTSTTQYARTIVYDPPTNILSAKVFEQHLRAFAARHRLQAVIESRGWLMRVLIVTMSGDDQEFVKNWPDHFLGDTMKGDPSMQQRLLKQMIRETEKRLKRRSNASRG
jgi:hypothetical protein